MARGIYPPLSPTKALQNVGKYSGAANAVVRLAERADERGFVVEDDGAGFDAAVTLRG